MAATKMTLLIRVEDDVPMSRVATTVSMIVPKQNICHGYSDP
jgi:hypothetical protein